MPTRYFSVCKNMFQNHTNQSIYSLNHRAKLSYLLLYLPAFLAWGFSFDPLTSFYFAWLGSWAILAMSMTGQICPLPADRPTSQQLFRPLFLTQVMFALNFCLGSIFYVWEITAGSASLYQSSEELALTASAQRYYVLGHAAFVHGLLAKMNYRRSDEWNFSYRFHDCSTFLLVSSVVLLLTSILTSQIPGLNQFVLKTELIALVAIVIALGSAIRKKIVSVILLGGSTYVYMIFQSLLSGWKHQTAFLVGLLLINLYPSYKRTVFIFGITATIAFSTILPAYNNILRDLSWRNSISAQQAAKTAINQIQAGEIDVRGAAWKFLSERFTTVSLFNRYIDTTPKKHSYYGFSIVQQATYSVIPRALWPTKPNTEQMVMQRVYENNAVEEYSNVSAKPKLIVDAYLSGGLIGVLIGCFLLGVAASLASRYAEAWFGGYSIGGQVIYTALFANAWMTASFEFLFNTVFWSTALMMILFFGLRAIGGLHPSRERLYHGPPSSSQHPPVYS